MHTMKIFQQSLNYALCLCCRLYWVDRTLSTLFYLLIIWMLLHWSDQIIAWGHLTLRSMPQMFSMVPVLRTLPEALGTEPGTIY
jgi:hypothetical protein